MNEYYNVMTVLSWMTLLVLCILIAENDRIPEKEKNSCYIACGLIGVSALAEWLGVYFDGNMAFPAWGLMLIKCADYILTPLAGGALVRHMNIDGRKYTLMHSVLCANIVFQIISFFTGWMVRVDEFHHYVHGPLYFVYVLLYLIVIGLVIYDFVRYGRTFRKQNRASLYSIMVLMFFGIILQEVTGSLLRTAYFSMTLGACLLFIHYTEFSLLKAEEDLLRQRRQINTDALTGVKSRFAYSERLKQYSDPESMPANLAAFTIDINGLKAVNDTLGHEAGDEFICSAAKCIENSVNGECFRTGGDEFVVLAEMEKPQAEEALRNLMENTGSWSSEKVKELSLSAGYALTSDYPHLSAEGLVRESDHSMYAAKADYYQKKGRDRRRR